MVFGHLPPSRRFAILGSATNLERPDRVLAPVTPGPSMVFEN